MLGEQISKNIKIILSIYEHDRGWEGVVLTNFQFNFYVFGNLLQGGGIRGEGGSPPAIHHLFRCRRVFALINLPRHHRLTPYLCPIPFYLASVIFNIERTLEKCPGDQDRCTHFLVPFLNPTRHSILIANITSVIMDGVYRYT